MLSESDASPTRSVKLFLSGGGTGGHVYPALAVAAALRARTAHVGAQYANNSAETTLSRPAGTSTEDVSSGVSLLYVGSTDGMEGGLVAKESSLPFHGVPVAALRGRSPLTMVRNLGTLARGVLAARKLIRAEQPSAIFGTGGYVCVPLFLAARAAKVPTVLYLPDVVPGLAVRTLARIATTVACNVDSSARYIKLPVLDGRSVTPNTPREQIAAKLVVTGYPVRAELATQDRAQCCAAFGLDPNLPIVFVYGGSRGARSINKAVAALLPHLLPITQIIHVCGREGDDVWLREAVAKLPSELQTRYWLSPYLFSGEQSDQRSDQETQTYPLRKASQPTMLQAFGAADLALCRSGASTLGELPAARLPAVLVPYPFVHQDENADHLVQHGAAIKVRDDQMLGNGRPEDGLLFQTLRQLIGDPEKRAMMSERSARLAQPEAAERLADLLMALAISKRPTS